MKCSRMVMIGAASRDVGKTEYACALIRRYAPERSVIGVKITVVQERHEGCPRGGKGCGVCGSLKTDYAISEETRKGSTKDTQRMLAAGAARALWLRVHLDSLDEGIRELLRRIPGQDAIVCESNRARIALEPGVFLVLHEKGSTEDKASCRIVKHYADRIVTFDGSGWDLAPERIVFANNRWAIRQNATAIVLAGGKSRRMGQDKSLLPIDGKPMIQHIVDRVRPVFDELVIGANDAKKYEFLGCETTPDQAPDQGPLMGILSCLSKSSNDLNFVVGCDIPCIHFDLIFQMLKVADGYDIVVPVWPNGDREPLYALYRKSAIAPAREILAQGGRRIVDLFDRLKVRTVEMPDTGWYQNVNTLEDYATATDPLARRATESEKDQL